MKRKIACFDLYKLFYTVLFISISSHSWGQKAATDYIEKHKKVAVVLKNQSGIPASIILGVSMIESAMGKSRNCKLLNNYFGVKGKNDLPKTKGAPRSSYKQYPNSSASFKDFVRIVKSKKYYPELKGDMDYKKWLVKMNQYGYAQAKGKWINDITSVIKKYDLDTFDRDALIFDDDTYPIWGADTTLIQLQEQD
jgi:flagellum-specific peptidoglycan hydrolase FlgJ